MDRKHYLAGRMNLVRPLLALIAAVMWGAAGGTAAAADWPTKPITMLIGYKAGGSTDTIGRVLAKVLGKELGQKVNVINKPGAGGSVAALTLKSAKPDGYTIYFSTSAPLAVAPLMKTELKYGLQDFEYGPVFHTFQPALVAPGDAPFNTFTEFVDYAKKHPPIKYATYSANTRMVMKVIAKKYGLKVDYVPVKGGGGVVPLILGKQVDISASGGIHAKYTGSGGMKVIASLDSERLLAYPHVRTLIEDGLDVSLRSMTLFVFPKGTPRTVIKKVETAVEKATKNPDVVKVMKRLRQPITFAPSSETRKRLEQISAQAKKLQKAAGFIPK